jgi:NAD(P)H-nitrite reductase large subunit
MSGLYLLPDDWYERQNVAYWLNTRATELDVAGHTVTLGTGETLPYDRLVLAVGARSQVPPIAGASTAGCFVLREADDAVRIRAYAQEHGAARAVVIGAGPLGIEAAYALRELGLAVSLLIRGERLLPRHVDERCSALLSEYLSGRGIAIIAGAEVAAIDGPDRVRGLALGDRRHLAADLVVVCAGLAPNADLARTAGIAVRRGVVVDPMMRTSAADVLAAGDLAELDGHISGLWTTAVTQATVAARNAVGGNEAVPLEPPTMRLKGIGLDVISAGRVEPGPGGEVIVREAPDDGAYARLVVNAGRLTGAVLLGMVDEVPAVLGAVRDRTPVDPVRLRTGDWSALPAPQ